MRRALAIAACALSSCAKEAPAPEGQWLLEIDTDAPLPPAPGTAPTNVALFDTLRIDVLSGGRAVPGLSREFAVDEGLLRARRASIGIVGAPGRADLSARVRLFRYARQTGGEPQPRTSLETTVRLPPVPADRVDRVSITLRTDDIGRALGYPEPVEPEPARDAPSSVGTWKLAARVPCVGEPRAGEACVPGGAYWFGGRSNYLLDDSLNLVDERLAVVSPFFVDATETTLGALDQLIATNPSIPPHTPASACVTDPAASVDCVRWDTAQAACAARGMQLPTEAQWEWLASGVGNDWEWPWGDDVPSCGDACFGSKECVLAREVGPPGSFPRDRVTATRDGPPVLDLAGNVSEWMLDGVVQAKDPPWSDRGVLIDPVGVGEGHMIRGAAVDTPLVNTRASLRLEGTNSSWLHIGFRCVRSAR